MAKIVYCLNTKDELLSLGYRTNFDESYVFKTYETKNYGAIFIDLKTQVVTIEYSFNDKEIQAELDKLRIEMR